MINNCDCDNCTCDTDFSEDNGYKYVLDELKDIRKRVDTTIDLLEKRIQKDKIINEVLSTEYDDNEKDEGDMAQKELEIYKKALAIINQHNTITYPYTYPFSNKIWYTLNYPYNKLSHY